MLFAANMPSVSYRKPPPRAKRGLTGAIFFVIDLVVFFLNVVMITLRVIRYPSVFAQTFLDQKEGVWFPMSGLAVATILINILLYGVPYCGVRFPNRCGKPELILFSLGW